MNPKVINKIRNCKLCKEGRKFFKPVLRNLYKNPDILFINSPVGKEQALLSSPIIGEERSVILHMIDDVQEAINDLLTYRTINNYLCCPKKQYKISITDKMNCTKNIQLLIREINPKLIVFLGNIPEKGLRKLYPEAIKVSHPSVHLTFGSKVSPMYLTDVKKIVKALNALG